VNTVSNATAAALLAASAEGTPDVILLSPAELHLLKNSEVFAPGKCCIEKVFGDNLLFGDLLLPSAGLSFEVADPGIPVLQRTVVHGRTRPWNYPRVTAPKVNRRGDLNTPET
jgi:hypothetical protein